MVTALAEIVAQQQRPEPTTGGANAPTQRAAPTTMTTTTAATAVHAQQNVVHDGDPMQLRARPTCEACALKAAIKILLSSHRVEGVIHK